MRIAVVDIDRCQSKSCSMECVKFCPGVRMGDETVVLSDAGKPIISEELCTGCGICVHKCPFEAIAIIGLPDELKQDLIHQYGKNAFRLYRLPYPRENAVTGLIGPNGIGKTTVIRILSGEMCPNLGFFDEGSKKEEVLEYFSGTQFYDYFNGLYAGEIKTVPKPQYVDSIPKVVKGSVREVMEGVDRDDKAEDIIRKLELNEVLDRDIKDVSGGELQRVAIAMSILKEGEIYIFDEPSSYLDVGQRLRVARVIRDLAKERRVVVAEHDLIVLDYLADYVTVIYGKIGAFGVISHPRTTREGINVYLDGYLKEENIKFRKEPVKFEVRAPSMAWKGEVLVNFGDLTKSYDGFEVNIKGGEVYRGEVLGILGPNALGKTTFVKMLAGVIEPDKGEVDIKVRISYKPQYIKPEFEATVREALKSVTKNRALPKGEVIKSLELEYLYDKNLKDLSGGEMQRVAIAMCLGREAEIYLLDEPSAYLDVEQRMMVAGMIRRIMENRKSTAIVVDHDILFTDYLSDRLMIFSGISGRKGVSTRPMEMKEGMNVFLKDIDITFRRDPGTGRPRANKARSIKDREQRKRGEYYYIG